MSIYKRLTKINCKLLTQKIPKTGYNKHKNFYYYELEDIMPHCMRECANENIALVFPYCEDVAILKLVDMDNPKKYITYRLRMPELIASDKNPNNKMIQDFGADITYLQRYLLKLAFPCFTDKDVIDMDGTDDDSSAKNTKEPSKSNKEVADLPMGTLVVEARDKLLKKGISEKEMTFKVLKQTVLNMRKWSVPERRCILNYFKEKEKSGGAK